MSVNEINKYVVIQVYTEFRVYKLQDNTYICIDTLIAWLNDWLINKEIDRQREREWDKIIFTTDKKLQNMSNEIGNVSIYLFLDSGMWLINNILQFLLQ